MKSLIIETFQEVSRTIIRFEKNFEMEDKNKVKDYENFLDYEKQQRCVIKAETGWIICIEGEEKSDDFQSSQILLREFGRKSNLSQAVHGNYQIYF